MSEYRPEVDYFVVIGIEGFVVVKQDQS